MSYISLPADLFRAVALAAAKNDIRYYLNGVRIELLDGGAAMIVATDGHALHFARFAAAHTSPIEMAFTLTSEATQAICKAVGTKPKPGVMIAIGADLEACAVDGKQVEPFSVQRMTGTGEIDSNYPQWRRLVNAPFLPNWPAYGLSAHSLDIAQRAAVILGGKHAGLLFLKRALNYLYTVGGRDDFAGICTPPNKLHFKPGSVPVL